MNRDRQSRRRSERGIALLIAIFVLLLISVVAIALLVSSGTETALGANYRSSSTAYYAALAGLEEARGRLLPRNPNYFGSALVPSSLPLGQTIYVTNSSGPGDVVQPWDPSPPAYYDNEYQQEFGSPASGATWQSTPSVWNNNAQTIPGPLFKWVRINAASRQSLNTDVDNTGSKLNSPPLYYDLEHLDYSGNAWPSLIVNPSPPPTAGQALELTAFAYLPNGSKKMLQYLVTPIFPALSFPAAVTLSGNAVQFSAPTSTSFKIDGTDHPAPGICSPGGSPPPVAAVGYTNTSDSSQSNIVNGINPTSNDVHYTGLGGTTPNVSPVNTLLASYLQNVGQLENFVQAISQNADVTITGPATQADMPSAMSSTNPMTIVVNGDLTFNGWHSTGYGILLVTGTFTFDPDASWDGIVLVIGKGVFYTHQGGVGQIDGAMFLATTVDSSGNPLPASSPLGSPYFHFTPGAGGAGVYYSSCLVNWAQSALTYKVLSFHEIPQ